MEYIAQFLLLKHREPVSCGLSHEIDVAIRLKPITSCFT